MEVLDTLNERQKNYGVYSESAEIIQGIKLHMRTAPGWDNLNPDAKESLEMIVHKIGRILNGNPDHIDSWHDISGYARLIEERIAGNKL